MGVREVDENTVFRIGSNSKLWTMLLYMTFNGTKYFEEPDTKYVPELRWNILNHTTGVDEIDAVRWEDVTIGQLASHQAGIARDCMSTSTTLNPEDSKANGFLRRIRGSRVFF